jgi:hypothetical protein
MLLLLVYSFFPYSKVGVGRAIQLGETPLATQEQILKYNKPGMITLSTILHNSKQKSFLLVVPAVGADTGRKQGTKWFGRVTSDQEEGKPSRW